MAEEAVAGGRYDRRRRCARKLEARRAGAAGRGRVSAGPGNLAARAKNAAEANPATSVTASDVIALPALGIAGGPAGDDVRGYRLSLEARDREHGLWEVLLAAGPAGSPADKLDRLRMPVLFITGDDDRIVPAADTRAHAARVPHAKLVVVPACGHLPQEERPRLFVEAVGSFFAAAGQDERLVRRAGTVAQLQRMEQLSPA